MAAEQVFLRVIWVFPLSVSFHRLRIHVDLTRRTNGRIQGILQKQCCVGNLVTLNRKVLHFIKIIRVSRSSCTVPHFRPIVTVLTKIGLTFSA